MLNLIIGVFYYLAIYLSILIAPIFAVIYSVFIAVKNRRTIDRATRIRWNLHSMSARHIRIGDLVAVAWWFLVVFLWTVLGGIIWAEEPHSISIYEASVNAHQFGELVWQELSFVAVTCIFTWWWIRLKREYVKSAFVLAVGGLAISRTAISAYHSLEASGFNLASIGSKEEVIFAAAVVFVLAMVLIIEVRRGMIAANLIVSVLALVLLVSQISKTHFLDAICIMIIPSTAIANLRAESRPESATVVGDREIAASLILAGSAAIAVLVSGAVPLMIAAPSWGADADVDAIVILNMAVWTAPFIGSAVVYIVMKRMNLGLINIEWVSLAWLILNFVAAFWTTMINIHFGGFVYLGDVLFDIWLVLSVGIGILAAGFLIGSLLIGQGAVIRPLFSASIWLAVLYAMTPLLAYPETPQVLRALYSFELALTLGMVFFVTYRVFGVGSPWSGRATVRKDTGNKNERAHRDANQV